jgi:hypothetical protein
LFHFCSIPESAGVKRRRRRNRRGRPPIPPSVAPRPSAGVKQSRDAPRAIQIVMAIGIAGFSLALTDTEQNKNYSILGFSQYFCDQAP